MAEQTESIAAPTEGESRTSPEEHTTEQRMVLQVVQPALVGMVDGTISTLAPIFATAYLATSRAALFVGLATAIGAGISMAFAEAMSDDGSVTGRGSAVRRGLITGVATALGGTFHSLPFLISNKSQALLVAYIVVAFELIAIALVRKRFLAVRLPASLLQVTVGGAAVVAVGIALGHA